MISRLRDAFGGGTGAQSADAAVSRGMADLLAALDNVIDDDAALGRICARFDESMPSAAPRRGGETVATPRARGPAASWRPALRPVGAAAVALAAGAVALVAVVVPGSGHGGTDRSAVDAAYVVQRVDSALSAAGPGEIAQMSVTTHGGAASGGAGVAATAEEWSSGGRWRSVAYSSAGDRVYDEGFSIASGYTVVSYQTRTWARQHGSGGPAALAPGSRGCAPVIATRPLLLQPGLPGGLPAGWLPSTVARDLRAAISCGTLVVAGRPRVDGIEAIELTSRPDSPISETVWVSPGTYLPVRVVIRPLSGQPGPWQTADITWLAPSAQNLARLNVPVPPGFRQVPLAQVVTPDMHIRVWTRA
jgi:hypothetical protein